MFSGDPADSWQIRQGDDWLLGSLLWVRDTCGLTALVQPELPPCAPAVPATVELPREEAEDAAQAWTRLWAAVVRDDDERHATTWPDPDDAGSLVGPEPGTQALRAALADGQDRLHDWHAAARDRDRHRDPGRRRENPVALHERRLGRTAHPFRLQVIELPVAGRQGWVVDDSLVLLSAELAREPAASAAFLDPVIARLV